MAKVFIVDDEPMVASTLSECLSAAGHDVYTESDGLQALSRMIELGPDVVLSDVLMPVMGGAPLLTAMQENAYLGDVPVIIMSSLPEHEVAELCGGYAAFLRKPFGMAEMVSTVERVTPVG